MTALQQKPPKTINVAVHVRLGDVMPWNDKLKKYIPIDWYIHVLEQIRILIPQSKIHIFTSSAISTSIIGKVNNKKSNEFVRQVARNFSMLGYIVHVSDEQNRNATEEVVHTMAHFASADLLITAKSDLGITSGYLNPKCVIFIQDYGRSPLAGWIALQPHPVQWVDKAIRTITHYLPKCLSRNGLI